MMRRLIWKKTLMIVLLTAMGAACGSPTEPHRYPKEGDPEEQPGGEDEPGTNTLVVRVHDGPPL